MFAMSRIVPANLEEKIDDLSKHVTPPLHHKACRAVVLIGQQLVALSFVRIEARLPISSSFLSDSRLLRRCTIVSWPDLLCLCPSCCVCAQICCVCA
ncbi:hypothetical protein IC575_024862 [Cucumis melo]